MRPDLQVQYACCSRGKSSNLNRLLPGAMDAQQTAEIKGTEQLSDINTAVQDCVQQHASSNSFKQDHSRHRWTGWTAVVLLDYAYLPGSTAHARGRTVLAYFGTNPLKRGIYNGNTTLVYQKDKYVPPSRGRELDNAILYTRTARDDSDTYLELVWCLLESYKAPFVFKTMPATRSFTARLHRALTWRCTWNWYGVFWNRTMRHLCLEILPATPFSTARLHRAITHISSSRIHSPRMRVLKNYKGQPNPFNMNAGNPGS